MDDSNERPTQNPVDLFQPLSATATEANRPVTRLEFDRLCRELATTKAEVTATRAEVATMRAEMTTMRADIMTLRDNVVQIKEDIEVIAINVYRLRRQLNLLP
jgi:hypothetical protein